ncbi:hypothetical protein, partial [Comamonas thiooxydans]
AHEEGEKQNLIHILSLAAQVKGWVSLRWKWRVSYAWKLTDSCPEGCCAHLQPAKEDDRQ